MAYRTVTGNIKKIDGTPWTTKLRFRLVSGNYDLADTYPGQVLETEAIAGSFSISLWCDAGGLTESHYELMIERDRYLFKLPYGNGQAVNISELRAAYAPVNKVVSPVAPYPNFRDVRQVDLVEDSLIVDHGITQLPVKVTVTNNLDEEVQPTNVAFLNLNAVKVGLQGYTPITGTWRIRVL